MDVTDARACAGASANGKIADSTALLDRTPMGRSGSHSVLDAEFVSIALYFPLPLYEENQSSRLPVISFHVFSTEMEIWRAAPAARADVGGKTRLRESPYLLRL